MSIRDQMEVEAFIARFLASKEELGCPALALVCPPERLPEHLPGGWVFYYQSQAWVETRDFSDMLVGQGPNVLLDDGRFLEGCSSDRDAAAVLRRYGEANW